MTTTWCQSANNKSDKSDYLLRQGCVDDLDQLMLFIDEGFYLLAKRMANGCHSHTCVIGKCVTVSNQKGACAINSNRDGSDD